MFKILRLNSFENYLLVAYLAELGAPVDTAGGSEIGGQVDRTQLRFLRHLRVHGFFQNIWVDQNHASPLRQKYYRVADYLA